MSSEDSDGPTCECCGCFEIAEYTTPCCHVGLCIDHKEELMLETCSNEDCPNNSHSNTSEKYCMICFDINSISNRCKTEGCKFTWCDNCLDLHKCP